MRLAKTANTNERKETPIDPSVTNDEAPGTAIKNATCNPTCGVSSRIAKTEVERTGSSEFPQAAVVMVMAMACHSPSLDTSAACDLMESSTAFFDG